MNDKVKKIKTTRRPYRKPQLEEVRLVPEEAVLGACKAGFIQIGPFGNLCGFGLSCSTIGS